MRHRFLPLPCLALLACGLDAPPEDGPPDVEVQTALNSTGAQFTRAGWLQRGQTARFELPAPATARNIRVAMSGWADADLYTRIGAAPTESRYDCRPYRSDANETCTHASSGDRVYVMVRGYSQWSYYSVSASWDLATPSDQWLSFALDSVSAPAIGTDGASLHLVATAFSGAVGTISVSATGTWTELTVLEGLLADKDTAPTVVRAGTDLLLLLRGRDDNLHFSRYTGNGWGATSRLTDGGVVQGPVSAVFAGRRLHVLYGGAANTVVHEVYALAGGSLAATASPFTFAAASDGKLGTDGDGNVVAVVRGSNERRATMYAFDGMAPTALGSVEAEAIHDVSNVVFYANRFSVVLAKERVCGNAERCFALEQVRFTRFAVPVGPDAQFFNWRTSHVANYSPVWGRQPASTQAVYRNRLVLAYNDPAAGVRYARWDVADGDLPWVGVANVGRAVASHHRPALVAFDARDRARRTLSAADRVEFFDAPNFGNDLFAAAVDDQRGTQGRLRFINFSRAIFVEQINRSFTVWNWDAAGSTYSWSSRADMDAGIYAEGRPVQIGDLRSDNRPFYSEMGNALWALPSRFAIRAGNVSGKLGCIAEQSRMGEATYYRSGRFEAPCATRRYPLVIKPGGGIFIASGAFMNRDSDSIRFWEELGHSFATLLGMGSSLPSAGLAAEAGLGLTAMQDGWRLFQQSAGNSCPRGRSTSGRCRGYTGIANNYDTDGRQHSMIYVVYYYLTNGDLLRQLVQEDLAAGDDLLDRKYDWVRDNVFGGVEYTGNNAPRFDL